MFAAITNTFSNCFRIPELKSRILFTMLLLAVCRLEAYIHCPGLDGSALAAFPAWPGNTPERRPAMGEKNSKKDKNKAKKQRQEQMTKKQEQQKNKLPAKKPV